MARFFMIFLFLYTHDSFALNRCPETSTSNHLVVTLEGLGGELLGSPAYRLANRANTNGYQIARYSHRHSSSTIAACVRRWLSSTGGGNVSIVGHSLGGGAANQLAATLASQGVNVRDMIVFDGREGSEIRCGGNGGPTYNKPENVDNVFNFYQCGGLPGRTYAAGSGVHNMRLNSSHIALPSTDAANNLAGRRLNAGVVTHRQESLVAATESLVFRPALSELGVALNDEGRGRARVGNSWDNHPKAEQPAICFNHGVRYECTYAEASRNSYDSAR